MIKNGKQAKIGREIKRKHDYKWECEGTGTGGVEEKQKKKREEVKKSHLGAVKWEDGKKRELEKEIEIERERGGIRK